jgi:hypothetical protein
MNAEHFGEFVEHIIYLVHRFERIHLWKNDPGLGMPESGG